MSALRDIVGYICKNYKNKSELSKARLTKLVYLADWRSAITRGRQLTDIAWKYNRYGPYVDDITDMAKKDPAFTVVPSVTFYGDEKEVIQLRVDFEPETLSDEDRAILDHVIETTSPMFWDKFIKLVYSTYPIVTQPRFSRLDLVALAEKYRQERQLFKS